MSAIKQLLCVTLLLCAAACAEERANLVLDRACTEGLRWQGLIDHKWKSDKELWTVDHRGAPEMTPGRDCIACHAQQGGRAPRFLVAGTVFRKLSEPSDCLGVGRAEVEITCATGEVYKVGSNEAGNFILLAKDAPMFATPYSIKIRYGGREGRMYGKQTSGSCNSCHTATGDAPPGEGKPPGRICVDPDNPNCMPR